MAMLGSCEHNKVEMCDPCAERERERLRVDPPHVHQHQVVHCVTVCAHCGLRKEWTYPEPSNFTRSQRAALSGGGIFWPKPEEVGDL